jgi:cardiolipin synthase A/B
MYHCKVFIVDEIWVSVGSTNFDDRSFRLNDEVNLNIYDAEFAVAQVKVFNADLRRCRRVTRGELNDRSSFGKVCDRLALTLRRQL